jgi:hypothetical protein
MDLAGRYSNWLPGACEGGLFSFGGVNATNQSGTSGTFFGGVQDYSYSPEQNWHLGQGGALVEGFTEMGHTPVGGGAILPSGEVLGFAAPYDEEFEGGGSLEGGMFAALNLNHLDEGITIGVFGEGTGDTHGNVGGAAGQVAAGAGAYLTFTNAATCVDRYNRAASH